MDNKPALQEEKLLQYIKKNSWPFMTFDLTH